MDDGIDLPPPVDVAEGTVVADLPPPPPADEDVLPPPPAESDTPADLPAPPVDATAAHAPAQADAEQSPKSARKGPPTAPKKAPVPSPAPHKNPPPAVKAKTATAAVAATSSAVSSPAVAKKPPKDKAAKDKASKEKSAFEDDLRGKMKDSGEDLDSARKRNMAYEYLCHLEEARKWMEACLESELPPASELESALQNGVLVARLAMFFAPEVVKPHNIYDMDEKVFKEKGLVFRHTDNINQWLKAMDKFKFPNIFFPEVTDLYNRKNMPRVIYCLHALSRFLFHLGIAPLIEDLHGVVQFTEEELSAMEAELQKLGVQMPKFGKIGGILAAEMGVDEAAMHAAILAINQALDREEDEDTLVGLMTNPHALLTGVHDANKTLYRDHLIAAKSEKVMNSPNGAPIEGEDQSNPDKAIDIYETNLTKEEIQKYLNLINAKVAAGEKAALVKELLASLDKAIADGDQARIMEILQDEHMELEGVADTNAAHYTRALRAARDTEGAALTQAQVQDAVDAGNQVADALQQLQAAVDAGDLAAFLDILQRNAELFGIGAIDAAAAQRYFDAFATSRRKGEKLSVDKVKDLVAGVNAELEAVRAVNEAIQRDVPEDTMTALKHKALALEDVDEAGAFQYHFVLSEHRRKLGNDLTRDVIQSDIYAANKEAEENAQHAAVLFELNDTARKGNATATLKVLHKAQSRVENVQDKCAARYQEAFAQGIKDKEAKAGSSFLWMQFATDDGRTYYHNKKTKETQWVPPTEVEDHNLLLPEIQALVVSCNADQARWEQFQAMEPKIVELQALVRGVLVRKAFRDRLAVLHGNNDAVVRIQAAVRGQQQRRRYKERLDYLKSQLPAIIKIQAAWKGKKARDQYKNLTAVKNPPAATVRQFLHLLDQSDTDFAEELKLQQLKQKVVLAIKNCHQLDQDLNEMDIKIGLLVKNRIELQDVVKQSKQLKKQRKEGGSNPALLPSAQNLKSLTKSSRERLESYQHLFYLIQTHPTYLAKLVFIEKPLERWSEHKTSTFLQQAIQLVYNYASNNREQYLLHKLYREALQTEIKTRVDTVRDFITGNPTVIKLVVNHHRGTYIRETLAPLVKSVLSRDELDLNSEVTDVYKRWISRQEAETGERSTLPFEVDAATAYSHEPVRQKVQEIVAELLTITARFRDGIIASLNKMPYGLRYICNAVHHDLRAKFPDVTEDDILKVISNIIYYRFMNPAVIAPEAFDVVTVEGMANQISPVQRQNLANVAKLLQFAAAAQTYNDEHMGEVNKFLVESWQKFREFFLAVIDVESSEEHYNIDEYTDARMVSKPQITISPAEIFYLHEMLATNIEDVAPDAKDPLREILTDLGPVGDETVVLGEEGSQELAASKTPISVILTNKFEVPEADDSSIRALFVRTKRMVVDVIRFQQGKTLKAILTTPASEDMERQHKEAFAKRKAEREAKRAPSDKGEDEMAQAAQPEEEFVTLEDTKKKILANAKLLEGSGVCKEENGYQELLNAVAQDIRNQRVYRRERKAELTKLSTTLSELAVKKKFQSEQIDCYDHYVQACVDQMGKGKAKPRTTLRGMVSTAFSRHDLQKNEEGGQNFGVVRYTAAKLKERGVLLSVDGIDDSKLKNVQLEISSQETGVFQVAVKAGIMGLTKEMEKTDIVLQDLLQLQYEGKQTMKMFDICLVNVNLLIFLINKKFYGK